MRSFCAKIKCYNQSVERASKEAASIQPLRDSFNREHNYESSLMTTFNEEQMVMKSAGALSLTLDDLNQRDDIIECSSQSSYDHGSYNNTIFKYDECSPRRKSPFGNRTPRCAPKAKFPEDLVSPKVRGRFRKLSSPINSTGSDITDSSSLGLVDTKQRASYSPNISHESRQGGDTSNEHSFSYETKLLTDYNPGYHTPKSKALSKLPDEITSRKQKVNAKMANTPALFDVKHRDDLTEYRSHMDHVHRNDSNTTIKYEDRNSSPEVLTSNETPRNPSERNVQGLSPEVEDQFKEEPIPGSQASSLFGNPQHRGTVAPQCNPYSLYEHKRHIITTIGSDDNLTSKSNWSTRATGSQKSQSMGKLMESSSEITDTDLAPHTCTSYEWHSDTADTVTLISERNLSSEVLAGSRTMGKLLVRDASEGIPCPVTSYGQMGHIDTEDTLMSERSSSSEDLTGSQKFGSKGKLLVRDDFRNTECTHRSVTSYERRKLSNTAIKSHNALTSKKNLNSEKLGRKLPKSSSEDTATFTCYERKKNYHAKETPLPRRNWSTEVLTGSQKSKFHSRGVTIEPWSGVTDDFGEEPSIESATSDVTDTLSPVLHYPKQRYGDKEFNSETVTNSMAYNYGSINIGSEYAASENDSTRVFFIGDNDTVSEMPIGNLAEKSPKLTRPLREETVPKKLCTAYSAGSAYLPFHGIEHKRLNTGNEQRLKGHNITTESTVHVRSEKYSTAEDFTGTDRKPYNLKANNKQPEGNPTPMRERSKSLKSVHLGTSQQSPHHSQSSVSRSYIGRKHGSKSKRSTTAEVDTKSPLSYQQINQKTRHFHSNTHHFTTNQKSPLKQDVSNGGTLNTSERKPVDRRCNSRSCVGNTVEKDEYTSKLGEKRSAFNKHHSNYVSKGDTHTRCGYYEESSEQFNSRKEDFALKKHKRKCENEEYKKNSKHLDSYLEDSNLYRKKKHSDSRKHKNYVHSSSDQNQNSKTQNKHLPERHTESNSLAHSNKHKRQASDLEGKRESASVERKKGCSVSNGQTNPKPREPELDLVPTAETEVINSSVANTHTSHTHRNPTLQASSLSHCDMGEAVQPTAISTSSNHPPATKEATLNQVSENDSCLESLATSTDFRHKNPTLARLAESGYSSQNASTRLTESDYSSQAMSALEKQNSVPDNVSSQKDIIQPKQATANNEVCVNIIHEFHFNYFLIG